MADKGSCVPVIHETPRSCLFVSAELDDGKLAPADEPWPIFCFLESGNLKDSICLLSSKLDEGCSNGELVIVFGPRALGVGGEDDIVIGVLLESPKLMPPIVAEPFPVVS